MVETKLRRDRSRLTMFTSCDFLCVSWLQMRLQMAFQGLVSQSPKYATVICVHGRFCLIFFPFAKLSFFFAKFEGIWILFVDLCTLNFKFLFLIIEIKSGSKICQYIWSWYLHSSHSSIYFQCSLSLLYNQVDSFPTYWWTMSYQ